MSNGMETVYEGVWLHEILKRAGVPQGDRRPDPVGKIPLSGRAETRVRRRTPEQPDIYRSQVGRVHRAGPRTEEAGVVQFHVVMPCLRRAT